MEEFIRQLLKKVKLQYIICRKTLDAVLEGNDLMAQELTTDYKRVTEGLDQFLYSHRNIDMDEVMTLLSKKYKDEYDRVDYTKPNDNEKPTSVPLCAKAYLLMINEKWEMGEERFQTFRSFHEEVHKVMYTIMIEEYKQLEEDDKDSLFDYIALTIMDSPYLQEAFKGNYKEAERLSVPENFMDGEEIFLSLDVFLKNLLLREFDEIDFIAGLKDEYGDVISESQQAENSIDMNEFYEKAIIASIYAVARQRQVDIALPYYKFKNDGAMEIASDAAKMGEEYLKKHYKFYSKIKLNKED